MVMPGSILMGTFPVVVGTGTVAAPGMVIRAAIPAIATAIVTTVIADADVDRRSVIAAAVVIPRIRGRVAVAATVVAAPVVPVSRVIATAIAAAHVAIARINATREREGRDDADHFQDISHDAYLMSKLAQSR